MCVHIKSYLFQTDLCHPHLPLPLFASFVPNHLSHPPEHLRICNIIISYYNACKTAVSLKQYIKR